MKQYRVLKTNTHLGLVEGEIVYECTKHDWGLVREEAEIQGELCIAVTKEKDGSYPFIVIPIEHLSLIVAHTPGPWHIYNDSQVEHVGIEAENVSIVIFGADDDDAGVRGRNTEEAIANAHLIAAAPELLEALESVSCQSDLQMPADVWKKVLSAIAKAKGATP